MTPSDATARNLLRQTDLKPTLNRLLILQAIVESHTALTAREVYESVAREHALNRVTVYRILDLLAEKGAINRITCGDRVQHFCVGRNHSHFHCTRCGEVKCIDNETLQFDESRVSRSLSVTVSNISLQLEGLCDKCSEASPAPKGKA